LMFDGGTAATSFVTYSEAAYNKIVGCQFSNLAASGNGIHYTSGGGRTYLIGVFRGR
jgi:hypothetical protein